MHGDAEGSLGSRVLDFFVDTFMIKSTTYCTSEKHKKARRTLKHGIPSVILDDPESIAKLSANSDRMSDVCENDDGVLMETPWQFTGQPIFLPVRLVGTIEEALLLPPSIIMDGQRQITVCLLFNKL